MRPGEVEHLDVLVVGAGLSGIGAAHHLQTKCPWATYAVFEARDAIGGTWDLFRYPGIRSDSDMFTLGYSFRPWTGEKSIADGASILQYIEDTAAEAGIDDHIRFNHRIVAAEWSSVEARWTVTARRTDTPGGGDETIRADLFVPVLVQRLLPLRPRYLPDFAGMDRFEGTIVHPQSWPDDLDHAGKRVVVIGSGATAVTLVPALAETRHTSRCSSGHPPTSSRCRRPTPSRTCSAGCCPGVGPGPVIRWFKALTSQASYRLSKWRPELMKRLLRKGLERHLPAGYDIDTHFTPRYDPWDQRLCVVPDGDLFEALASGTASVVTDRIDTFTETGLLLESGSELDADVVVTATGLELLFIGGIEMSVDGDRVDPSTG
jgi:monooxygenase